MQILSWYSIIMHHSYLWNFAALSMVCLNVGRSSHCQIRGQNDLCLGVPWQSQAILLGISSKVSESMILPGTITYPQPKAIFLVHGWDMYPFPLDSIQVSTNHRFSTAMEGPCEFWRWTWRCLRTKPMLFQWQHLHQRKRRHRWPQWSRHNVEGKHMADCFHIPSFRVCWRLSFKKYELSMAFKVFFVQSNLWKYRM